MWVLILTLYTAQTTGNPAMTSNVTAIEFTSQAKCLSAGNEWLKRNTRFDHTQALCVPK
jgi:hypothetical protein